MAGRRLLTCTLVISSSILLLSLTLAQTAGTKDDNVTATVYQSQGTDKGPTSGVWKIRDTAGNETIQGENALADRSGWTKPESENQETMDGWLNSDLINSDVFIAYLEPLTRSGDNNEEPKNNLVKSLGHQHGRVSRIKFHEVRPRLDFYSHLFSKRRQGNGRNSSRT